MEHKFHFITKVLKRTKPFSFWYKMLKERNWLTSLGRCKLHNTTGFALFRTRKEREDEHESGIGNVLLFSMSIEAR